MWQIRKENTNDKDFICLPRQEYPIERKMRYTLLNLGKLLQRRGWVTTVLLPSGKLKTRKIITALRGIINLPGELFFLKNNVTTQNQAEFE